MILMIDNYDSFTYNLVQYLGELEQSVAVYRNDQIEISDLEEMDISHIVISPGPCTPNEAGISMAVVDYFKGRIPILGVCLGHQSIVQAFGGRIIRADRLMHGKTSMIQHDSKGIFNNLSMPFQATRYHSLVAERESLPDCFEITAWTTEQEIMAVQHQEFDIHGVQFHPESILTQHGHQLLGNFLGVSQ
ncbi:MAG: anthranilate synthase/aminodeoxychorismate synthase-like glutamine amidotransferase [Parasphingorhabdus sp.]|jgi:anthranilate synthase/aminodeoxychorismate synthase-like glutamine amidotransferase